MKDAARIAAGGAGILALVLGVVTARELSLGADALARCDAAAKRGDLAMATARARDAAESAAPGSPYPRAGYERLEAIARAAEARKDERVAIAAWGAMRAAATSTRGPFLKVDAWQALADEGLLRVGGPAQSAPGEVHASADTMKTALLREDAPAVALLVLLGASAAAFLGGAARLAFAGGDFASLRRERGALVAVAAGAILYALACFRA